jgi:general secretion pathway protein D
MKAKLILTAVLLITSAPALWAQSTIVTNTIRAITPGHSSPQAVPRRSSPQQMAPPTQRPNTQRLDPAAIAAARAAMVEAARNRTNRGISQPPVLRSGEDIIAIPIGGDSQSTTTMVTPAKPSSTPKSVPAAQPTAAPVRILPPPPTSAASTPNTVERRNGNFFTKPGAARATSDNPKAETASEALKSIKASSDRVGPRIRTLVPIEDDIIEYSGSLNLPEIPLVQFLEEYEERAKRTMIIGAGVNKQLVVSLVIKTDLLVSEVIQAMDIVLAQNQITVVPIGTKFLLAVGAAQALQEAVAFSDATAEELPESSTYLTKIIQLEFVEPKEVMDVIQKFSKVAGGIIPIESTHSIIIRDYAANVKRMLELVEQLDVAAPANEQIFEVIPIKYAPVEELANVLGSFTSSGSSSGVGGRSSSAGSNSSRTSGSSSRTGSSSRGSSLNNSSNRNTSGNRNSNQGSVRAFQSTAPRQIASTRIPTPGSASSSFQQRLQSIVNRAQGGDTEPVPLLGNAIINFYERSNSLLVLATREEMVMVRELIDKLDIVQPQVLIEAVIMDISLTDNLNWGVNILQQSRSGGNTFGGGIDNSVGLLAGNAVSNLVSTGAGFSYYGLFGQTWDVAVDAFEQSQFATILQRPRILTTHAETAKLFVGEERPFPGSQFFDFSGRANTQVERIPIGVELEVTPLINPDGLVVLEVFQSIQSFRGEVTFGAGETQITAPITTRREAQAKVAVKDGDMVILGGMIQTDKNDDESGIPGLRKLPLIGGLFRRHNKNDQRSELIVMLRPTVLATPELAAAETAEVRLRLPGVRKAERQMVAEEESRLKAVEEEEMLLLNETNNPKEKQSRLPIDLFEALGIQ